MQAAGALSACDEDIRRKANPRLVIDEDEALRTFEARLAPQTELLRNLGHDSFENDNRRQGVQPWKEKTSWQGEAPTRCQFNASEIAPHDWNPFR